MFQRIASTTVGKVNLPDPTEITGLSLWELAIVLGVVTFVVTFFWPRSKNEIRFVDLGGDLWK